MNYKIKTAAVVLMTEFSVINAQPTNYTYIQKPECVKWSWSGDVYNRKVICLEWRKKEPEKGKKP